MSDARPGLMTIFGEALERAAPADRAAYLDRVCGADAALRDRVEALLAAHAGAGRFLEPDGTAAGDATSPGPTGTTVGYRPDEATGTFASADPEATAARGERPPAGRPAGGGPGGIGTVIAGRYTLAELIGEGGMGSVYRASQTDPVKRQVALKLIKGGMDSKAVLARFDAERQALALMDHPNIARIYDGGVTPAGQPFFVMELVQGVPLTEYCDAKRLTVDARLQLFVQVCQAVQHAHQKGIIHRDLKPGNVLVTEVDGRPTPKVIDFGVAKATEQKLTDQSFSDTGAIVGTPAYMSPEQADPTSMDIDTRTDVYALGVVLYELLTGSPPIDAKQFKRGAILEILRMVREVEPPRPSTKLSTADALPNIAAARNIEPAKLAKLLRGELDWVVMKALEKDRTRRYDSANGFARDVQRYLADEVVEARPPSRGYRLRKFVKRNKGQVIAASLVLLALVGGIVGTTIGLLEANAAAEKERTANAAAQDARTAAENAAANEKAAKLREATQRASAEKARDRTRDVLDAMVSEVTGDSLATQKAISAEQKKFLEGVLGYYREFAGENPYDETSRARHAQAASRVGLIQSRLGRKEESAVAFGIARDGFAALVDEFPTVPAYRHDLAGSHSNLGNVLADLGRAAAAEKQYRQSLAIRSKLGTDLPSMAENRRGLATSHNNLGILLKELGRASAAEEQLRLGLEVREKLAADFPTVPAYRQDLAGSHNNLGRVLAAIGRGTAAEEQYRLGLAIQEKLAANFPGVPEYRSDLAASRTNLGIVLAGLGRGVEAEEQYRLGLAVREKLAADFPAVPVYLQDVAASHNNLGVLLTDLGQGVAAEEQFRKSLAVRMKLAADFPAVPSYSQELAGSHTNLGVLLTSLGRGAAAKEQYRLGLAVREKLATNFPGVTAYQVAFGGGCCNFGNLIRNDGNPAESLPWFGRAIDLLQAVHGKEPKNTNAKKFLRNSHEGRAQTYYLLQKFSEAVNDWDRAIELSPPAEQPTLRANRATSRLQAGMVAEALAEIAELTTLPNVNAGQWYDFACVYAVASGKIADKKAEYADRAMELLQNAVKAGYKDAAHLKKDTDFDPLLGREDFKKLLAELETKFPPAKELAPMPRTIK